MTKIAEILDRGATMAWSPLTSHPDVIAVGAMDSGVASFEDTGGELELYNLNLSKPETGPSRLGSVTTKSRFASVAWGSSSIKSMGLLAGGMEDGTVHVWSPSGLIRNTPSVVASFSKHASGPVKALQFNHLHPTQLATGGNNGQVILVDLQTPETPVFSTPGGAQTAEISSLAFNTQVGHIVASAAGDGSVAVWDLKSQKAWCELRAEARGQAVSEVCWNPSQGLHLVTASADDRNPVLKVWDLRASTSMPLATLQGHSQGILSTSWCPHDDNLLLSCGKDSRTILWDLYRLAPIADIPADDTDTSAGETSGTPSGVFSSLATSQQRRYQIRWSPIKRGVAATCSLDRKVQAHSVLGISTKCGRPPRWLKPSSSVHCGVGGALVSCGATDKIVRIQTVVEQPELVQKSVAFEREIANSNVLDFCRTMALRANDDYESKVWGFMNVIFEANARQQLLVYLGFDAEKIARAANEFTETAEGVENLSLQDGIKEGSKMSAGLESAVQKALLVGNFEAAVECCFRAGKLADALILASCGGPDLWTKTQERYFTSEEPKRPFLSIVSAVIHNKLDELVDKSDPKRWQETLAILSTYGKSEEFPKLCIALGERLESAGDNKNASLCFMCALSLDRAVSYWRFKLEEANKKKGSLDLGALHDFVVKVTVFLKSLGPSTDIGPEVAELFSKYAQALAEQGMVVTAAKYSRGSSRESKELRDRLYRSRFSHKCLSMLGSAPEFPYSSEPVNKSRTSTTTKATNSSAAQSRTPASSASTYSQQLQGYSQQQPQVTQNNTQASRSNQQYAQTQQQQQQQQAPAQTSDPNQLPAGWIALQDPSSGRTYYANQTTGQTTWEKPAAAPAAQPAPAQPTQSYQEPQPSQSTNGAVASTPSRLASKYGDGFVSSASHPELANQYGNVGTSNPYTVASRPGIAAVEKPSEKPPVSGTLDLNAVPDLHADLEHIKECLLGVVVALQSVPLTVVDKRQFSEAEKGVAVLLKRLARGDIDGDVLASVSVIVDSISRRDFASALSIQTRLVNSDWKDHKDWLKGIKFLLQLASKKLV